MASLFDCGKLNPIKKEGTRISSRTEKGRRGILRGKAFLNFLINQKTRKALPAVAEEFEKGRKCKGGGESGWRG